MKARPIPSSSSGRATLGVLVLWLAMYFGIRGFLESSDGPASSTRLALAFIPTPVFALFLVLFIRGMRAADELERRIQLEALAIAFPLGLLLLTTLGLAQRAVTLRFEDWSYNHVVPMFVLFYLIGVIVARKRYT